MASKARKWTFDFFQNNLKGIIKIANILDTSAILLKYFADMQKSLLVDKYKLNK